METFAPGLDVMDNVHPLTVHLPLALWLVAFGFLVVGAFGRQDWVLRAGRALMHLGTLTGIVAIFTGLIAAQTLPEGTPGLDHLGPHRNWMLVATGLSLVASFATVILLDRRSPAVRWVPAVLLLLVTAASYVGADRGGFLVYGYGTGTRLAEPPAPRKAPAPSKVVP